MDGVVIKEPTAEEIYRDIQYKLNSKMVSNPKFKELFLKEVNYIYYKTNNKKIHVEVKEEISLVSLKSYNKIVDCRRELLEKNESFIESVFYLFEDDLVFEYSQGIIFDKKDLDAIGLRTHIFYETKLQTNYIQRIFNKDGIEFSYSSYSDSYPLKTKFEDVDIEGLITSNFYSPTFNTFHLPESPIHIGLATIRNTYRNMNELHLVHSNIGELSREGYRNVTAMLATTHTNYPEQMRAEKIFAQVTGNKNEDLRFKVIDTTLGKTISEISERAKKEFRDNIENSLTKRYNPEIVDLLKSYI